MAAARMLPRSDSDAGFEVKDNPDKEVRVGDVVSDHTDADQVETCKNHSDANGEDSGVDRSTSDPVLANHEQEAFRELVSHLCQDHVDHREEPPCEQAEDETSSSTLVQNSFSESDATSTEVDDENDSEDEILASQWAWLLESAGVIQFQGHLTEVETSGDDNESSVESPSLELLPHRPAAVYLQEPEEHAVAIMSDSNLSSRQRLLLMLHYGLNPREDEEQSPVGSNSSMRECHICFEDTRVEDRTCCGLQVCEDCFVHYLTRKVSEGITNIQCPNTDCSFQIHAFEIASRMPCREMTRRFLQFLVDASSDPTTKTCPRCSETCTTDETSLKNRKVAKKGLRVTCQACALEWCFTCHAPWHERLTCKEYRRGDEPFRKWARGRDKLNRNQTNAQRCPKCKAYIQRTDGCPHMTCPFCATEFCYDCGERLWNLTSPGNVYIATRLLLGSHESRLSPLGCRKHFLPNFNVGRKLIRGSLFGVKIVGGVALGTVAAAVALGAAVVALPVWGGFKITKRIGHRISARGSFEPEVPYEDALEAMPGVYRRVCRD